MAEGRTLRVITIAVWVLAALVLVGLAFVRGTLPTLSPVSSASGAHPVVYEFSTDT